MKALCLDANRELNFKIIAAPSSPPRGYVTVAIEAAAINHGDKTFMRMPKAAGGMRGAWLGGVWGASGVGLVTEVGPDVPQRYLGRKVAIYRSLQTDLPILGTWCEIAQIPYLACLPLPDQLDARDYSGSLVNVVTAYSFLEQTIAEGHHGIVITAGGSATGRAMVALASRRHLQTLVVVRSDDARRKAVEEGAEHVLASDHPEFLREFEELARQLNMTAVFDGVGGDLISRLIAVLPPRSVVSFYGFLSGTEDVVFHSAVFMMKELTCRRFSNFDSAVVREESRLITMIEDLETCIENPVFKTTIGRTFDFFNFEAALAFHKSGGRKSVFVPE